MSPKKKITSSIVRIAVTCLMATGCLLLSAASSEAQDDKAKRGSFVHIEPNYYSPALYSESLNCKVTLINLPGADQRGSYLEVEYEIYFVSEVNFDQTMRRLVGRVGTANPQASDFTEKILLARGSFKATRLNSLQGRTRIVGPIAFKSKIPDAQRTKAANLITSYSVKIHDARLKRRIFDAGVWITKPFEADPSRPETAIPRRTLYANFFVSNDGDLFKSQWPRNTTATTW